MDVGLEEVLTSLYEVKGLLEILSKINCETVGGSREISSQSMILADVALRSTEKVINYVDELNLALEYNASRRSPRKSEQH